MTQGMTAITRAPVESDQTGRSLNIATFAPARPILVLLGMHRSGTSLCSHILSVLGVDMTDEVVVDPANQKGYWERNEIVAFHDAILKLFGRGYYTPQHDLPLPPGWWANPRLRQPQREVVRYLEREMTPGTLFGFKDPRTARLFPIWHQVFNELNLVPKIVLCLRNPAQVARSLHDRDGLDLEIGEFRWFSYMIDIFRNVHDQQICTIEYDTWFDDPEVNLEKLMSFLDIRWRQSDADLRMAVADIVDHRLRHDRVADLAARHPLVRSFYKLARSVADDPAARERVEYIVSQVVTYQQLHRPLHREFDRVWAQQEAISAERIAEAAALRDELAARDAALAGANRRAEEIAAALAPAQAQTEEREAALAEANRRAEAISRECAAEAAALRGELAARDAALAEANAALARVQQEAALRNAASEAAQQEVVATRDELAARDAALAEANHRTEETTATLASAQAQLEEREAALARAEAISAERVAEVAVLRDELEARDAALAEAKHRPRRSQQL